MIFKMTCVMYGYVGYTLKHLHQRVDEHIRTSHLPSSKRPWQTVFHPSGHVTRGTFSCNLQRNDDGWKTLQVTLDMWPHVTRSNLSRNVAKSRGYCFFSCNLQHNILLHCKFRKWGVTQAIVFATCNASCVALQAVEKIASCNVVLKKCRNMFDCLVHEMLYNYK